MTLEQYKEFGQFKLKCKCTNRDKIRYTLANSLEHCYSKFSFGWECVQVTEEEFLTNYPFTE